jgi:hypothetical protein
MPQQPGLPDGWEVVDAGSARDGGTGVPEGWELADDATREKPGNDMGILSAATAAGAAAIPAARGLAERIATSPMLTRAGHAAEKFAQRVAHVPGIGGALNKLNAGKQLLDVYEGKQSPLAAAGDAARNWAMSNPGRILRGVQGAAGRVATGLAAPAAVPIAGGLAGLAGTTGFLAALQHDANRDVTIDPSKPHALDTAIAKVLMDMQRSEAIAKERGQ